MRPILLFIYLLYACSLCAQQRPHNTSRDALRAFGVKGSSPGACRSYGINEYLTQILSSCLTQEGDSVFLYFRRSKTISEMISGPDDGIALDLVCRSQFRCNSPNDLDPSPVFDGFMLQPVYRDALFKNNRYKDGRFMSFVGKIPRNAPVGPDVQINVILIQNGMACRYSYPLTLEREKLPDLSIDPLWCKTEGTIKSAEVNFTRRFSIPFQKNDVATDSFYFEKLSRLVRIFDGAIDSIEINAYSSVEGTEEYNIQLLNARADFIEKFIAERIKQKTSFIKTTAENWPLFKEQIQNTPLFGSQFTDTSMEKLRSQVNQLSHDPYMAALLDEERVATITLYIRKSIDDTVSANFLPLVLYNGLLTGDTMQQQVAYSRMIDAYRRGEIDRYFLTAIEVPLRKQNRAMINNYLASILVESDIFNFAGYNPRYYEYIDSAQKMFPRFKPLAFNLAVYKTHLYLRDLATDSSDFRNLGRQVANFKKDLSIDTNLTNKLRFNYYLTASIFHTSQYRYEEGREYFKKVKPLIKLGNIPAHDVAEIARYYNYFGEIGETQSLLDIYIPRYPDDAELAYLYVSTGSFYNMLADYRIDAYLAQIDKLAKLDRDLLCTYFNINYQLSRIDYVKSRLCSYCALAH